MTSGEPDRDDDGLYEDLEPDEAPYTWSDECSRGQGSLEQDPPPSTSPPTPEAPPNALIERVIDERIIPREGPVVETRSSPLTHHQQMQSRVATASLVFVGVVLAAGAIRWLIDPAVDLASYTANLLAPIIGLVATIVGYFFGIASREPKPHRRSRRKGRPDRKR